MRFIRVVITSIVAFAIMMMPFLMAPEIEELTTQYQKSKDSLRLEYEELVDETVVESMIIIAFAIMMPFLIAPYNIAVKLMKGQANMKTTIELKDQIEELNAQYQKSKDSLRLEYEELVEETVVESMIITTVLLIIIMISISYKVLDFLLII